MRKCIMYVLLTCLLVTFATAGLAMTYGQRLCGNPSFTCMKIHRGESWESLFSDPELRTLVMKLNRMNIPLHPGAVIAIPNDLVHTKFMDLSPFAQQIPAPGEKLLIFDPGVNAWGAYDANGKLVRWGPGSSGRDWCPDIQRPCHTKTGEFMMYNKVGAECISSKFPIPYGGAPMPYCMYFHGGYAFHGSREVPGYNASHGCIRMFIDDAQWLNQQFIDTPNSSPTHRGTKVIIHPYPSQMTSNSSGDLPKSSAW